MPPQHGGDAPASTAIASAAEPSAPASPVRQPDPGSVPTKPADTPTGEAPGLAVLQADVAHAQEVQAMVDGARQALGPVDVLVNNAGGPRPQELDAITLEDCNGTKPNRSTGGCPQGIPPYA